MAVFSLIGFLGAILIPVLFASLIADLTPLRVIVLVTVATLIGGYFILGNSDAFQTLYWKWTLPPFSPGETAFAEAAGQLRALRLAAVTEPGRDSALHEAEARLCALPTVLDNWSGRVQQRYSVDSGGGASLAIGIAPHLVVRTAFFPDKTGTLIHAGTPLFGQVNDLEQGDVVRFSGTLIGHAGACPGDPPIDPNEKQRDPEFLVRFTQVATATAH